MRFQEFLVPSDDEILGAIRVIRIPVGDTAECRIPEGKACATVARKS